MSSSFFYDNLQDWYCAMTERKFAYSSYLFYCKRALPYMENVLFFPSYFKCIIGKGNFKRNLALSLHTTLFRVHLLRFSRFQLLKCRRCTRTKVKNRQNEKIEFKVAGTKKDIKPPWIRTRACTNWKHHKQ